MVDLTDEMKGFLNSNLAWVATISKEGQVDLGPKMSMFIIDNNHIGYHERTAGQTYRNLLDGSDLVVAVANLEQKKGYRFRGNVVLHSDDAIYDEQVKSRRRTRHEKADDHSGFGDHGNSGSHSGRYGRQNHRQGLIGSILNQSKRQYRRTADGTVCPVCGSLLSERKIANLQHIVRGGSTMDSYTAVACMGCG